MNQRVWRVVRISLGTLLPLAIMWDFASPYSVFRWLASAGLVSEEVLAIPQIVPNSEDVTRGIGGIIVDCFVVAIAISIVGWALQAILIWRFPRYAAWLKAQRISSLLTWRIMWTVLGWTVASMIVAWHDGTQPLVWLRHGVGSVAFFAALQMVVGWGAWFPIDPRDMRPFTMLSAEDVEAVRGYARDQLAVVSEADSSQAVETPESGEALEAPAEE